MRNSIAYQTALLAALLLCQSCQRKPYYIRSSGRQLYTIDSLQQGSDSAVARFLQPYKAGVDTQMQTVVGHAGIPLTKAQPESTLGNFMADAQLEAARRLDRHVSAAVLNYGGMRLSYIPPGPLTRGTLYELMPFDNMLVIVEMPGETLQAFCDFMAARKGWPVSGLVYTIREGRATDIRIAGQPLDPHLVYRIATNDYIAKGGDNSEFMRPLKKHYTSILLRDTMIQYLAAPERAGRPLQPEIENRVRYAE